MYESICWGKHTCVYMCMRVCARVYTCPVCKRLGTGLEGYRPNCPERLTLEKGVGPGLEAAVPPWV